MKILAVLLGPLLSLAAMVQASKPKALKQTAPVYPHAEEQARHGGRVELRVSVDEKGGIAGVEVLRGAGYAALDQAAMEAVQGWERIDEAVPPNLKGLALADLPTVYERLLEDCAANPGANMMETYLKIATPARPGGA